MANYTSQLQKRRTPEKPINTELVGFVLQSKEQAWDANQAKIDETLSQIGSIDLIRDKDKEHLLGNIENLLGNIQNVGKLDLSSDTVSRGLQNAVLSSIDDKTIEQAVNTRNIRRFQSEVSKIKEEEPEKYNDLNYSYALEGAGFGQYMSGDSDTLGALTYNPYIDVSGKIQKGIKDLRDYNKETEVKIPVNDNGIARILTKKVKDLNEVELRGYVMSQLGSQERQQLAIDGWGDFRGYSDNEVKDIFTGAFSNKVKGLEAQISVFEEQLKNAPQYQKDDIQNRIAILSQEKRNIEDVLTASGANRNIIERVFKEQQLVDNVIGANLDIGISYSFGEADDAFYKAEDLKLKAYEAETKRLEALAKQGGANDANQILDVPAMAIHEDQLSTEDILKKRHQEAIDNLDSVYDSTISPIVNSSKFSGYDSWSKYKEANANSGKSEREMFQEWTASTGNDIVYETPSGETRMFSQDVNEATDTMAQTNQIFEKTVNDNFEANIEEVYDEALSKGIFNNNKFPIVRKDGSFVTMDSKLQNYTLEDFKANKDGIKDLVRTNLYKNRAFSTLMQDTDRYEAGFKMALWGSGVQTGSYVSKYRVQEANKWLTLAGGDKKLSDYVSFVGTDGKEVDLNKIQGEGKIAGHYIPKDAEALTWLQNIEKDDLFTDTTVGTTDSDWSIDKIVSTDKGEVAKNLEDNFYTFGQRAFVVKPNLGKGGNELSDVYQRVSAAITAASETSGVSINLKDKQPIILQEDPTSPEYLYVIQTYTSNRKGVKGTDRRVGKVLKETVEKELGYTLAETKGEPIVNNAPVESAAISYLDGNTSIGKDKQKAFISMINKGDMLPVSMVSQSDLMNILTLPVAQKEDGSPTEASFVAANIIQNPANVKVKYVPKQKGGYVVIYNTKTGEEIHSIEVRDPQNIKKYRNTVRYAPQEFIGTSLKQMVTESSVGSSNLFNKYLNAISK